ncbi:MAG TPA: methyltransferase domain-containing protein, partial [Candidatus Paceibacterota bacterium]|nr:methyltransferase domain-containing protein [Candidatus Paceibacterota bacterium]
MFMDPALVLARCNLQSTDSVAEFGAGSGALARAAAALVPHGTVFAIDVHRDVVRRLAHDAADEGLRHLYALWGDIETHGGSMLADNSINLALLSNVLFHLDDRGAPFKEAHRVLVPEGKLLVVDWLRTINGVGPRPQALV